jgi:hypothetical protein
MAYGAEGAEKFVALLDDLRGSSTGPRLFGLDFNSDHSSTAGKSTSSMQLGSLAPEYRDQVVWARQGYISPEYHYVMLKNMGLQTCSSGPEGSAGGGPVRFLGDRVATNSFVAMVDTGQVCLQLPGEMYESVTGWLLADYPSADDLPAIGFQVDTGHEEWAAEEPPRASMMHLLLKDLLLPAADLEDIESPDRGAPAVTVGGVEKKLCILRLNTVFSTVFPGVMLDPAPTIVLGSLALQSVYFAADFSSLSVGLAPKQSPAQVDALYASAQCASPKQCVGDQVWAPTINVCAAPLCDSYFFAYLDQDTQTCRNRLDLYNAGLVIVCMCVLVEAMSYFVMQYSALQLMGVESGDFRYTRPMNTHVDMLTYYVGKALSKAIDVASKAAEPLMEPRHPDGLQ